MKQKTPSAPGKPTLAKASTLRVGKPKLGTSALTASIIAAMQPGEELADPATPGLRVRCGAPGADGKSSRVFFYRYRDTADALRQIKLGEFGPMTLSGARAAHGEEKAKLTRGGDPQGEKRQKREHDRREREQTRIAVLKDKTTCGAIVEHYLVEIVDAKRKAKGAAEARRMLERAITNHSDLPADDLTRSQAHEIVLKVAKTAPRVAAMTRQELRACWEHALSVGRIRTGNPFAGKTIGGKLKSTVRKVTLDHAETGALLRWMREPNTYSRTVADALELTLRTALRTGEVCGIHSTEFEERDGVLWLDIPADRMKKGEDMDGPHQVPLVGRAREIVLARIPDQGGYLFPSRRGGGPIQQKVLGVEVYSCSGRSKAKAFAKRPVCPIVYPKKWPGKAWAPHDLRRTARTFLGDLNCPFEVGEAIVAHKLPGVAGTYNQSAYRAQKIEWLTKLNEHLDTLEAARNLIALNRRKAA